MVEGLDRQPANPRAHGVERALPRVVRARKVHEHESRDPRVFETRGELGGLLVREVTEGPAHAALELWRIGPDLEELRAIVRFEEHEVTVREERAELPANMTHVGGDREAIPPSRDAQGNMRRVVGDRQRLDHERPERERPAWKIRADRHPASSSLEEGAVVRKERGAERAREGDGVGGVVPVIVGHDDPKRSALGHELRSERPHAGRGSIGAHARVENEALAVGLDDEAVPA